MKKTILILTLVGVIGFCLKAVYNNIAPYEDDGYLTYRERAIIKKFDKDGDGRLNSVEQKEADNAIAAAEKREAEQKAAWMKRYDKNGDGKISDEEKRAAEEERKAARDAALERFDKNGDGKLSKEERQTAEKAMASATKLIDTLKKNSNKEGDN